MNTKKIFSFLAGVLVCLSVNGFAVVLTLQQFYDQQDNSGNYLFWTNNTIDNQHFNSTAFESSRSTIPAVTYSFPKVAGGKITVTYLGSFLGTNATYLYGALVSAHSGSGYTPAGFPFFNNTYPSPLPLSFASMIYPLTLFPTDPYNLDLIMQAVSEDQTWTPLANPRLLSYYDVTNEIGDPSMIHYGVGFTMGDPGSASFFDVFFDLGIPVVAAVPEPHIYVLIGSMLALAYVLGRKKAKVQC